MNLSNYTAQLFIEVKALVDSLMSEEWARFDQKIEGIDQKLAAVTDSMEQKSAEVITREGVQDLSAVVADQRIELAMDNQPVDSETFMAEYVDTLRAELDG